MILKAIGSLNLKIRRFKPVGGHFFSILSLSSYFKFSFAKLVTFCLCFQGAVLFPCIVI